MTIRLQELLGALIAAIGIIWGTWLLTQNFTAATLVGIPPRGPLEVCATGVIIWLIAKWRHSVQLR